MNTAVLDVNDRQADFLESDSYTTLLHGGRGGGKSLALCLKLVQRALHRGAREGLCRKHLKHLKATTLKTLLEGDGTQPPVLPRGSYDHNKSECVIKIRNGGDIVYFGLDDPLSAGSFNLTGLGIDELIELAEYDFRMLQGCVRVTLPGLPNQIYGACNPSVPSHWVAREFGLALAHKPRENCRAIFVSPTDNFALPESFLRELDNLPGLARKRFLEGKWVGSDGLVYDQWNRNIHVQPGRQDRRGGDDAAVPRTVIAVDEGYANPFVGLALELDGDVRVRVVGEFYLRQQSMSQKIAAIKELGGAQAEAVIVDPSAASLIREMNDAGLPVQPANNSVFDGIMRVQARLIVAGDGRPRLTVDPSCENLIREFETYEWKPSRAGGSGATKDEPIKAFDHALDALRYAVTYLDRGSEPTVAMGAPQQIYQPGIARRPDDDWETVAKPADRPYGDTRRAWQRRR